MESRMKEIFSVPTLNHPVIYKFIYVDILWQSWQLYTCNKTHFHQLTRNKCETVVGKTKNKEAQRKEQSAEVRSTEQGHVYNIASVEEMKGKDVRSVYPEEAVYEEAALFPDHIRNKGVCVQTYFYIHTLDESSCLTRVPSALCEFTGFKPVAFQKTFHRLYKYSFFLNKQSTE